MSPRPADVERKKILFLQKRFLFPTDSGGKIRTLNVLRHLAKWHDVTYLCNVLASEEPFRREMQELGIDLVTIPWTEAPRNSLAFFRGLAANLASPYPFNVNKDYDKKLRLTAEKMIADGKFDLLICDFVQMARNCLEIKNVPKLLFEHNVEAQIFERHSKQDKGFFRRTYMWLQWKKMLRFERNAGLDFDRVVAVSNEDREYYREHYGWKHTDVIDTAVDTEYFAPLDTESVPHRCVFIGSMDWLPNEDGIQYFVNEVWPLVRDKYPNATFQVVGRNPQPATRSLDGKNGVHVTGSVPDVRPFVAESQVNVIPLLVGGGTRLKAFEAMAMGKPIVSTSLGVEGLKVTDNENLMIADAPDQFADRISQLFESRELRSRLASRAGDMVRNHYSAEVVARQFEQICFKTLSTKDLA